MWKLFGGKQARPAAPAGCRVYAIGDIHGRDDLLQRVFDKIDQDQRDDPVPGPIEVYLGDYVDRGPASRTVVDLLIERGRSRNAVFLRGNHESYLVEFIDQPAVLRAWRQFGGIETLLSYGMRPSMNPTEDEQIKLSAAFHAALPGHHLAFYRSLSPCYSVGDFFFVHAGVRPGVPLTQQDEHDLMWIRDEFLLHEDRYEMVVVHGHTPVKEPEFRPNRINIDTGAYATGRLTCLRIEHDHLSIL